MGEPLAILQWHAAQLGAFSATMPPCDPKAGNTLLSALAVIGMTAKMRAQLHYAFTASWLCSQPEDQIVVGFFRDRERAVTLSFFNDEHGAAALFLPRSPAVEELFIGIGLVIDSVDMRIISDPRDYLRRLGRTPTSAFGSEVYDLRWKDGKETVRFDDNGITVVRSSLSSLHNYVVKANASGLRRVVVHSAGEYDRDNV